MWDRSIFNEKVNFGTVTIIIFNPLRPLNNAGAKAQPVKGYFHPSSRQVPNCIELNVTALKKKG